MAEEIERKYLVRGDFRPHVQASYEICQAYLNTDPARTVRVRTRGNQAFITVKGLGNSTETTRFEWEQEIALDDAKELLKISEPGKIEKVRHIVDFGGKIFEVDEFRGDNAGLIIAEVELVSEEEAFQKPDWLGEEVTSDYRYYNNNLIKHPYPTWSKKTN